MYDYIWTAEDPLAGPADPSEYPREGAPLPEGETSTHVAVYTLYLSGFKQRYRHFLRQPDGTITEVGYQHIFIQCVLKERSVCNKYKVTFPVPLAGNTSFVCKYSGSNLPYDIGSGIKCN